MPAVLPHISVDRCVGVDEGLCKPGRSREVAGDRGELNGDRGELNGDHGELNGGPLRTISLRDACEATKTRHHYTQPMSPACNQVQAACNQDSTYTRPMSRGIAPFEGHGPRAPRGLVRFSQVHGAWTKGFSKGSSEASSSSSSEASSSVRGVIIIIIIIISSSSIIISQRRACGSGQRPADQSRFGQRLVKFGKVQSGLVRFSQVQSGVVRFRSAAAHQSRFRNSTRNPATTWRM